MEIPSNTVPIVVSILSLVGVFITHRYSDATQLRKDLLERCNGLNVRIDLLTADLDRWKEKYFVLSQENIQLKNKYLSLTIQLEDIKFKFLPKEKRAGYGYTDDDDDADSSH